MKPLVNILVCTYFKHVKYDLFFLFNYNMALLGVIFPTYLSLANEKVKYFTRRSWNGNEGLKSRVIGTKKGNPKKYKKK